MKWSLIVEVSYQNCFEFKLQGTYNSQNLRQETLVIADYKHVKKSSFALLELKLWLKEGDDSLTDRL